MLLVSASEGTSIVALSLPLARSRNKNLLSLSASAFVLSAEIVIDPSSTLMSISSLSMPCHHTRKLRCCAAPERSCKGMKDQDCKVHNNKIDGLWRPCRCCRSDRKSTRLNSSH